MSSETSYFCLTQKFSSADLKAVDRSIAWIDERSELQKRAELKKKTFQAFAGMYGLQKKL